MLFKIYEPPDDQKRVKVLVMVGTIKHFNVEGAPILTVNVFEFILLTNPVVISLSLQFS